MLPQRVVHQPGGFNIRPGERADIDHQQVKRLRIRRQLVRERCLALLLGGSFSNTYDRLRRKYVVDYLSFPVKWKWFRDIVFNISDFCIIIGALLAALGATR